MKIEFLILIPEKESFCSTKKAFVEFINVDSLLLVTGQKIVYKKSIKSKDSASAKFHVEIDKVKSKQERYFLLTLQSVDDQIDGFNDLCEHVRSVVERVSPGQTTINTLWDDVGRAYAEKSYPLINEVENLMRRLIAKFMLLNVGVNWSKDTIHPDLFKKIENYNEPDPYVNDLFKLDFIHLKEVLFGRKRDITTEELDRIILKGEFSQEDLDAIKRYAPRSNWEKFFSSFIEEKESSIETKWDLLYKLRNKVAHNRYVKKSEYEQIKGLTESVKSIINKAAAKLGEIDVNEEDRELMISNRMSTKSVDSVVDVVNSAIDYALSAIIDYYVSTGCSLVLQKSFARVVFDFILKSDESGEKIGFIVKRVDSLSAVLLNTLLFSNKIISLNRDILGSDIARIKLIIVVSEGAFENQDELKRKVFQMGDIIKNKVDMDVGAINKEGVFELLAR